MSRKGSTSAGDETKPKAEFRSNGALGPIVSFLLFTFFHFLISFILLVLSFFCHVSGVLKKEQGEVVGSRYSDVPTFLLYPNVSQGFESRVRVSPLPLPLSSRTATQISLDIE